MLKKLGVADLHDSNGVVVEYGGHVFGGKLVRSVRDQEAGLPNSTVTHHDTP